MKEWYESKAVWGAIVTILVAVLGLFHITISAPDQDSLVNYALTIAGAIGGLVALYGRVAADVKVRNPFAKEKV